MPHIDPSWLDISGRVEAVCEQLATTAIERDARGGHPGPERELLRRSGLLSLTTPVAYGGAGQSWTTFYRVVRRIAEVDSALAHLFAFHHLQIATVLIYGESTQHQRLLTESIEKQYFWGNALNPSDKRATAQPVQGGYVIHGPKSFCSGSVGSDMMTVSAWSDVHQAFMIAVVPTQQAGIRVLSDWNAFGQRQTDSGTVTFDQVFIPQTNVLRHPDQPSTPWVTLRPMLAQHILVNLYAGLAKGALQAGLAFTSQHSRAWPTSGVEHPVDDHTIQLRYGELWAQVKAADVLAEHASEAIDHAYGFGQTLDAQTRGHVALQVAEAKVIAHRAAIDVTSRFFELTGARAANADYGLDRFWRNARVHTLHDPVDQKLRDLGRFALTGRLPEPTSYS